jgi:hypothetical protein
METASINSDGIEISTNMVAKEVSKVIDVGGIPEETLDFDTSLVFRLQPKEESGEDESTNLWYSDSSVPIDWLMCEV